MIAWNHDGVRGTVRTFHRLSKPAREYRRLLQRAAACHVAGVNEDVAARYLPALAAVCVADCRYSHDAPLTFSSCRLANLNFNMQVRRAERSDQALERQQVYPAAFQIG
jgi:hypothetical protein